MQQQQQQQQKKVIWETRMQLKQCMKTYIYDSFRENMQIAESHSRVSRKMDLEALIFNNLIFG